MNFYVMTLFPEMFESVRQSILKRASDKDLINITLKNIREYSLSKHKKVDDMPYGGGAGMVMEAEPIYRCFKDITTGLEEYKVIYMTPKGATLNHKKVMELKNIKNIIILCGHYEGVDQRIIDLIVDEEISIGDYVLTGGEIPAMIVIDSVSRYVDGVLNSESLKDESFSNNLLEYPQYTRPSLWKNMEVPKVLLSGNHKEIDKWRLFKSEELTKARRPDLLENKED
ncbi:MAG: tRNA (guanosine(37)-N1)-methyltransferase TrmD [Lachnospirales bacterium]